MSHSLAAVKRLSRKERSIVVVVEAKGCQLTFCSRFSSLKVKTKPAIPWKMGLSRKAFSAVLRHMGPSAHKSPPSKEKGIDKAGAGYLASIE